MSAVGITITAQSSGAESALAKLARQATALRASVSALQGQLGQQQRGLNGVAAASQKASQQTDKAARSFNNADRAARKLGGGLSSLKAAAGGLAAAFGLNELAKAADTYTNINNKLRLVTTSTENLSAVNEALFASANRTRSSYESTASLYATMARATRGLGLSQQDMIGVTETLNQGFQVSGATSEDAASGIRQLGQALTGGLLRGEEFNTLSDSAPRLLEALAAGIGKPRSELRKLAEDQKLTSAVVIKALQDQGAVIASEFGRMTPTIAQAGTVLRNNFIKLVGDIDKSTGASRTFSTVIMALANNLPAVGVGLTAVAGIAALAFGSKIVGGIKAATSAVYGFTGAMMKNPIGLIAVGVTTAIAALVAYRDKIKLVADDTKTAADESITLGDVMSGMWSTAKEEVGAFSVWFSEKWAEAKKNQGKETEDMGTSFAGFLQQMGADTAREINAVMGFFQGAYFAITGTWGMLPAAFSDIAVTAGNNLIAGLEAAINRAGQLVKNGPLGGLVGGMIGSGISLGRLDNPNAGASQRTGQAWNAGWQRGQQDHVGNAINGVRAMGERGRRNRGGGGAVSNDRTTPSAAGSGNKDKESESAKKAKEAIDKLTKAREDLNVRMREADYTARELAAAEALGSAGLDRNVRAAQGLAKEIVDLSNKVFDAEKQFEDMKASADLVTESKERLASATNALLAVTQPELAAHQATVAEINNEYAARMKALDATNVTIERRAELVASYEREKAALLAVEAARQQQIRDERAKDQGRRLEDARMGARAVMDPQGANVAQQLVEITRQRDDAMTAIINQGQRGMIDYIGLAREAAIAQQEMENVVKTDQFARIQTAVGEVRNGITTMFQGGKQAMLQYFADLALQFVQAKLMAMAMKTDMASAFSSFGGGGASGGALGAIFGLMKGGGGGAKGGLGGLLGGLMSFLPGRESGGPVSSGKPYVVGEKRPEVFVPRQSGMILPSVPGGGGSSSRTTNNSFGINITVEGGGAGGAQQGQQISTSVERTIRRIIRDENRQKGR